MSELVDRVRAWLEEPRPAEYAPERSWSASLRGYIESTHIGGGVPWEGTELVRLVDSLGADAARLPSDPAVLELLSGRSGEDRGWAGALARALLRAMRVATCAGHEFGDEVLTSNPAQQRCAKCRGTFVYDSGRPLSEWALAVTGAIIGPDGRLLGRVMGTERARVLAALCGGRVHPGGGPN